jgi:hypothetical protein
MKKKIHRMTNWKWQHVNQFLRVLKEHSVWIHTITFLMAFLICHDHLQKPLGTRKCYFKCVSKTSETNNDNVFFGIA